MINEHFSFIVLTLNEEQHLPRLLHSIEPLKARVYVLDSGSTDQTLSICLKHQLQVKYHPFYNHPKQWDVALRSFDILTPWVICLDADQTLSRKLITLLQDFRDSDYSSVNGIYFNRKNYFKGKWIRFGGYYPKYLLKMFRYQVGYSDLQENMDHRFQVQPKTAIWKKGYLIEENLKENEIRFWIEKHNRYSDLLAEEEIQRLQKTRSQETKPKFWGSPNERNAWYKNIWWKLPRYLRPFLYFTYRMIFQLGVLDGTKGLIFHFLQGFWFRLIVDIKISEKMEAGQRGPVKFTFSFLMLFFLFYAFNLLYIGLTTPGDYYIDQLAHQYNYIRHWRNFCLSSTSYLLKALGYSVSITETRLINHGYSGFRLVYSCLGYGVMSCFAAFVIAYPKSIRSKILFLLTGLIFIQILNTIRFIVIAIYYQPKNILPFLDHHTIFNFLLYLTLGIAVYIWSVKPSKTPNQ